jgi:hypothetical protein
MCLHLQLQLQSAHHLLRRRRCLLRAHNSVQRRRQLRARVNFTIVTMQTTAMRCVASTTGTCACNASISCCRL